MSYAVAKNICQSCRTETKVYFENGVAPKVGEVYRYGCPGCGQVVYFRPDTGAVIVNDDESIPEGLPIAEKKVFH